MVLFRMIDGTFTLTGWGAVWLLCFVFAFASRS